ncbi:MAG: hypothetical protein WCD86_11440, partial [Ktedonobacteraceae bacterium]
MEDSPLSQPPTDAVPSPTDAVPWTFQQTLSGATLTLVPWLLVIFVLNNLGGKQSLSTPLSARVDLTTAIINLILSAAIEAVFLI